MVSMFLTSSVDRQGQIRADGAEIRKLWDSADSRTLLWSQGQFIMQGNEPRLFGVLQRRSLADILGEPVYLGLHQQLSYFACCINPQSEHFDESHFVNLRKASRLVNEHHLDLMFYAQGVLNWLQNHAFCSRCGGETDVINAGHGRQCKNSDCAKIMYPKIDPAVIFSIINNSGTESKILLGRQKAWDQNRYSVVAGFVEPGETLEDAVRREAQEETGLRLDRVDYIASQAWPFPDSLMLGFSAECSQNDITLIDQELEMANWFSASEIESKLKAGQLKMPFEVSISWHLINRWFKAQKGYSLDKVYKQVPGNSF